MPVTLARVKKIVKYNARPWMVMETPAKPINTGYRTGATKQEFRQIKHKVWQQLVWEVDNSLKNDPRWVPVQQLSAKYGFSRNVICTLGQVRRIVLGLHGRAQHGGPRPSKSQP